MTAVDSTLTIEDLLAGGGATHRVDVPAELLDAASSTAGGIDGDADVADGSSTVVLRPLVLADVIRIERAARDDDALAGALMVSEALVDPPATFEAVQRMPAGLVEHLLAEVNRISGLALSGDQLSTQVRQPLARTCFVLSREFGWTPEQCAELTIAQVLLYLEMLGRGEPVPS